MIQLESTGHVTGLVTEDHEQRAKSDNIASTLPLPSIESIQCDLNEDTIIIDGQNQSPSSHPSVHKATGKVGGENLKKRDEELAANNANPTRLLLLASSAISQIQHQIIEEVITVLPTIITAKGYQKGKEREVSVSGSNEPPFNSPGAEPVQSSSAREVFISGEAATMIEISSSLPLGLSGMHILSKDFARLSPNHFLNDTLIECGLKFVLSQQCMTDHINQYDF